MMPHIGTPVVHLATQPVDMRKSINGLSVLVADHLGCNPLSGMMFVFYNKARDKIKILYWERNGFCLWYKRLEKHRFHIPTDISGSSIELSSDELSWLLSGLDLSGIKAFPTLDFSTVM
ncbi:MAG: IS66 family insertion sequence element accessory protein TnpB [Ghiorsea sp.]